MARYSDYFVSGDKETRQRRFCHKYSKSTTIWLSALRRRGERTGELEYVHCTKITFTVPAMIVPIGVLCYTEVL